MTGLKRQARVNSERARQAKVRSNRLKRKKRRRAAEGI